MTVADTEHTESRFDADAAFRHWSGDLHQPEVLIWTGRRRVRTVLRERTADGTMVLSVDSPRRLAGLADQGRLALVFRGNTGRGHEPVPLFTTQFTVDRHSGAVEARFPTGESEEPLLTLPRPITAAVENRLLFQRSGLADIVRLSPYWGEFVIADPGRCLAPGMAVTLNAWSHWLGRVDLRAQLTACAEDADGTRFAFRMADRRSVKRAALMLVGSAEQFTFDRLRACGVRPRRLTRHLRLRTVSDEASYREALDLRLVGNQHFGRLADFNDPTVVADHLDAHSAIFVCELGDKPVGTGRVVANDGKRALSEIESETSGLPEEIWRGGFVEVSRLAIHPDYRGAGIATALFREIGRLGFALNCRYLVLDAIDKLVPTYEKIGAKQLPLTKTHPYSGEPVRVMAIDIGEQLGRLDLRWPRWQYLFGPVLKHQLAIAAPRAISALVSGGGRIAFSVKRLFSRLS